MENTIKVKVFCRSNWVLAICSSDNSLSSVLTSRLDRLTDVKNIHTDLKNDRRRLNITTKDQQTYVFWIKSE